MKALLLPFFLLCLLAVQAQERDLRPAAEAEKLHQQARRLLDGADYLPAVQLLDRAISLKPTMAGAYYDRAVGKEYLGDFPGAIRDYDMALRLDRDHYDARFAKAMLLFHRERYPEAIETFSELLQQPVGETKTVYFKMQHLGNGKMSEGASGITSSHEGQADLLHYRGIARLQLKDYQGAEKDFDAAIAMRGNDAEMFVNRGLLKLETKQTAAAVADFNQALALDPGNSLALYNLAVAAKQRDGNPDQIRSALEKAIDKENRFPSAYVNRGVTKYESGLYQEAIHDFDTAIQLENDAPDTYINRGLAKSKLRRYTAALADFQKAARLDPAHPVAWMQVGNMYYKLKKYTQAVEAYNTALAYDFNNANIYYNRGLALYLSYKKEAACQDLQRALELGMEQAKKPLKAYCE